MLFHAEYYSVRLAIDDEIEFISYRATKLHQAVAYMHLIRRRMKRSKQEDQKVNSLDLFWIDRMDQHPCLSGSSSAH